MSDAATGLTKIDIAALKQADAIEVNYPATTGQPAMLARKRMEKTETNPFAPDYAYHTIASAESSLTPETWDSDVSAASGHASISIYQADRSYAGNHAAAVLSTVKVGDVLQFNFYENGHCTSALRDAGFTADSLSVYIKRGGRVVAKFTIEINVTNHTWRFVRGVIKPVKTEVAIAAPVAITEEV